MNATLEAPTEVTAVVRKEPAAIQPYLISDEQFMKAMEDAVALKGPDYRYPVSRSLPVTRGATRDTRRSIATRRPARHPVSSASHSRSSTRVCAPVRMSSRVPRP